MQLINITRATAGEQTLLYRLLQLYYFESSRWSGEDARNDGLYDSDYDGVAHFTSGATRDEAWLVRVGGLIAGFALIERYESAGRLVHEFADLFILPKYRAKGIASRLVEELVLPAEHAWLIAVFRDDINASKFWKKLFDRLPFGSVREVDGDPEFYQYMVKGPSIAA
jgi:predicted acetyltransferase